MRLNRLPDQQTATMPPMYRLTAAARLRMSVEWLLRRYLLLAGVLTMSIAVAGIAYSWSPARIAEPTGDAYVQKSTPVASRISGCVSAEKVEDHQSAKAGQTLVLIDERNFGAAWDQARADDRAAQAAVDDLPKIRLQIDEHTLDLMRAARDAGSISAMDLLSIQSQLQHDRTIRPLAVSNELVRRRPVGDCPVFSAPPGPPLGKPISTRRQSRWRRAPDQS